MDGELFFNEKKSQLLLLICIQLKLYTFIMDIVDTKTGLKTITRSLNSPGRLVRR